MPNRILKESICTSDTIDALGWFEEAMFYRLIVNCDDYGRMDARPAIIKAKLFPLKDRISLKNIQDALVRLADAGCVKLYDCDSKPYLYLPSWGIHQNIRAKKSKYPEPESGMEASASNCMQMYADASNCSRNPIQSESNPNTNPNTNARAELARRFDSFWSAYPKKAAKTTAEKAFGKIKPDDELLKAMLDALEWQKRAEDWKKDDGKYIPYPATWLNQRRWEDEKPRKSGRSGSIDERDYEPGELDAKIYDPIEEILRQQEKRRDSY